MVIVTKVVTKDNVLPASIAEKNIPSDQTSDMYLMKQQNEMNLKILI